MHRSVLPLRVDVLLHALPSESTTLFCRDPTLALLLRHGGTSVGDEGDVEIAATSSGLSGSAAAAIVPVEGSLRTQREARLLRARGYEHIQNCRWWSGKVISANGERLSRRRARGLSALVGRRAESESALTAVLAAAEAASAEPLGIDRVTVGNGCLVGVGRGAVLRIGAGRTAELLGRHIAMLDVVQRDAGALRRLAPAVLAHGTVGTALWSLEQRLNGIPPSGPRPPTDVLLDCVDTLAALHVETRGAAPRSLVEVATDAIAGARTPRIGQPLLDAARTADEQLAGLTGGIVHGDFWSGNLLLDGGRLSGIVDWAAAETSAHPVVDLLHLLVTGQRVPVRASLGEAVGRWLRGGVPDGELRSLLDRYAAAVGLELGSELLSALLVAYWIRQVGRQVAQEAGLEDINAWAARNVDPVLAVLGR